MSTASSHVIAASALASTIEERDALVLRHLHQVRLMARQMSGRLPAHVELADLVSAGVMGLLHAVDRFDPRRDASLATYAHYRIRGAILDSLRTQDWAPRRLRRFAREMEAARQSLALALGRPPNDLETTQRLNLSLPTFHEQRRLIHTLALATYDDSQSERDAADLDSLPAKEPSPLQGLHAAERQLVLSRAIHALPPRERQVIRLYYLEEMTMKQTGAAMGVTESRICQMHSSAMARLRKAMRLRGTIDQRT
ncbi:MAG TPA: FliA/WhiG family RNA polymerase sigma factor [Terriglobales bacterium]|nr:FliA/WhiG family RNA polymerase sigma factor [Terriglobales bacterium]